MRLDCSCAFCQNHYYWSNPSHHEAIATELDRRKLQQLVDDGTITARELAEAPVVIVCQCGTEQDVDNERCKDCKEVL